MTRTSPLSPSRTARELSPPPLPDVSKLSIGIAQPDDAPSPTQTQSQTQTADDELERFRKEWRSEVQERGRIAPAPDSGRRGEAKVVEGKAAASSQAGSGSKGSPKSPLRSNRPLPTVPTIAQPPDLDDTPATDQASTTPLVKGAVSNHTAATATATALGLGPGAAPASSHRLRVNNKDRAVQLYAKAVESEQSGKLNEALILYRKAFKLDDDVDRSYTRSVNKAASAAAAALEQDGRSATGHLTPTSADIVSASAPVDEPYSFQRHIQTQPDYERAHPPPPLTAATTAQAADNTANTKTNGDLPARPSVLTSLFASLPTHPSELPFLPAEEDLPIPIASLPAELFDPILSHLDVASIERFASTCWRARYLTHHSDVWKNIALGIYRNSAMLDPALSVGARDLVGRHGGEWRTTLVEEERVRMDGCYISVCHYVRPGAGEQWVTITHLITYHRYLRFYPDGSCISFLTTDHPSEVVPLLRPSLRAKGLHFGRWQLVRSDSASLNPDDPSNPSSALDGRSTKDGRRRGRIEITQLLEPGAREPKYEFEMELSLRETARGKWNKLDIIDYRSINLLNDESLSLSLKHQKPFYFSKVKSYNPPF